MLAHETSNHLGASTRYMKKPRSRLRSKADSSIECRHVRPKRRHAKAFTSSNGNVSVAGLTAIGQLSMWVNFPHFSWTWLYSAFMGQGRLHKAAVAPLNRVCGRGQTSA